MFMKYWFRNNLDKLDRLTPQDVYTTYTHDVSLEIQQVLMLLLILAGECRQIYL